MFGATVIDNELITRNFPEGGGTLEMLCAYQVHDGRIRRADFAAGVKTIDSDEPQASPASATGVASPLRVRRAQPADLDSVSALFDEYRRFQGCAGDSGAARAFIRERLQREDSLVLLAQSASAPVGFAQLYPSFWSVSLSPVVILNDLFVRESARHCGAASALLAAVARDASSIGAARVSLNVAHTNLSAQALSAARAWARDEEFFMYHSYPARPSAS